MKCSSGELYRQKCATRIQAAARGLAARHRFESELLRRARMPANNWDASNDFIICAPQNQRVGRARERRVTRLTNKLVGRLALQENATDRFLAEVEASVAVRRAILQQSIMCQLCSCFIFVDGSN